MRDFRTRTIARVTNLGGLSIMVTLTLLFSGILASCQPSGGTLTANAGSMPDPVVKVVSASLQAGRNSATGQTAGKPGHVDPGMLQIWDPDGKPGAFCPLKGTDVVADVTGFGARVTVRQTFTNPSKTPIEAIYTFPLPADAAVDHMRFVIGNRIIEGQIKRREEARRIYEAAKNAGQAAALLDQERPNIFTQSVANIMPGQQVQVEISYVQLVKFEDDWFEFSFPMVVGPRFLGNAPDPGRIAPPIVAEGKRTGADIRLRVNLDAGAPLEEINSVLHEIDSKNVGKGLMAIDLAKRDEIPNRDFILRYKLSGNGVRQAFFTHADPQKGGFFTLILTPPDRDEMPTYVAPKEMIFVMDQSGSQSGFPIEKSKELMRRLVNIMRPDDTFNCMGFSNVCNALWSKSLPNSAENRQAAIAWFDSLQANGGTQLKLAIDKAMSVPPDPKRVRIIVFNTDGYVGDEFNILDTIQKNRNGAHVFTFGIGNSVNRFLIDSMSAEGAGDSEIVTLASDADLAVSRFAERMNNPVLTNISVKIDGVPVADVLPGAVPDVFGAKPVVIKGRYLAPGPGMVRITGMLGGKPWSKDIPAVFPKTDQHGSAVASLWAREKVDEIMRSDWLAQARGLNRDPNAKEDPTEKAIVDIALRYGIMTQYTSFVAVEQKIVNVGGKQITVQVPVEMADGVSYEGIFGRDKDAAYERGTVFTGNRKGSLTRSAGVNLGGGYGGGGFGGGAAAARPTTAGKSVSYGTTVDGRMLAEAAAARPEDFKKGFDKLSDDDVAAYAGISAEAEKALVKDLSPAQKLRYFKLTRVEKPLWQAKGSVTVQVWIRKWSPAALDAIRKTGAKVLQSDANLKVTFVTVDAARIASIAEVEGVVKIKALK